VPWSITATNSEGYTSPGLQAATEAETAWGDDVQFKYTCIAAVKSLECSPPILFGGLHSS